MLVFNSPKRILQMQGVPCLMKEIAEIFECGQLDRNKFRPVEFIQCVERYASIE
jgi:hypothetical protein